MGVQNRGQGKVVDTWYWERDDGARIPIQLRLVKKQKEGDVAPDGRENKPPYPTSSTEFCVEMDDPFLCVTGTDCEVIRKTVFDALDKRYAVKWEWYYLVEIRPEKPYHGLGQGFCLQYTDIEKGIDHNGFELLRERVRYHRDHSYRVEPWPGEFRDEKGRVQACIPATERNKAALREFEKRISDLRETMKHFLSPEVIESTLANLAGLDRLLPPVPKQIGSRAITPKNPNRKGRSKGKA